MMKYNNNFIPLIIAVLVLTVTFSAVYAAQTITDRVEIDNDDISADIAAGDQFGYVIEAIGDLDGDGKNELIVGANSESNLQTDLWVLFLNNDGSVASHPATPVSGLTIGIDSNNFIDGGLNN